MIGCAIRSCVQTWVKVPYKYARLLCELARGRMVIEL